MGDLAALPGTTVTIEPGSKVLVSKSGDRLNLHWLPWDLRSGFNTGEDSFRVRSGEPFMDERLKIEIHFAKLVVLGTKEQPVEIRSYGEGSGSPYDFNVISMGQGIISYTNMSDYRRFTVGDEVTIRDSNLGNVAECAVCAEYSNPSIINNVFGNSLWGAVFVKGGSPKISDNLFAGSYGEGIILEPKRFGAPLIYNNSFEVPGRVALRSLSGDEEPGGAVSLNDFAGDTIVALPCNSKLKLVQNQIRGVVKLIPTGSCIGSISFGPNYWLTPDKEAILREKIVGKEANFEVFLPSVLSSPSAIVGRRSN